MTVAVTGATGVVGGAVLRHLIEAGRPVRALVRRPSDATRLRGMGVETVDGDIGDLVSLGRLFEDAEVAYHIAGANQMCCRDTTPLYRVNVAGTRNVVRAARACGVGRIVYTSSAATLGEPAGIVADETVEHRGSFLSHYERSKFLAERVVLREAPDLAVLVNPSSVQGPGRVTGTGRLLLDVVNGRLPVLVDSTLSIVDIDDCARGHLAAEHDGLLGERYILNSFTLGIRPALDLLSEALGVAIPVRFAPGSVVAAGATVIEVMARLLRRESPVCREMVRVLRHGHAYDGGRAARELGVDYTSPAAFAGRLVAWWRTSGLVGTGEDSP